MTIKQIYESVREACEAIGAEFNGELPSIGKSLRLKGRSDKEGQTSIILNVHGDCFGTIHNFRNDETVGWRNSDTEKTLHWRTVTKVRKRTNGNKSMQTNKKMMAYLLKRATPLGEHPYLKRKGLTHFEKYPLYEIRRSYVSPLYKQHCFNDERLILVPLQDIDGNIRTAQFISEKGDKIFLPGSMKGCFFCTHKLQNAKTIGLAEGVATALSIAQVKNIAVVAAMSCSQLENIAKLIKSRYQTATLVIFADKGGNGEKLARNVAVKTNSYVRVPKFSEFEIEKFKQLTGTEPTDFNDLYLIKGKLQ